MEKSINIKIAELTQQIVGLCNTSTLPLSVLDLCVKDIYGQIHSANIAETQKEVQEYNMSLQDDNQTKEKVKGGDEQ